MQDTSERPESSDRLAVPFAAKLFATGFYSGYAPIAPGTAGSLVAALVFMIPGFEGNYLLASVILFFFIGVYASAKVEKAMGEDPSIVVIDEVVGMWISVLFLPKTIAIIFISFLLFRIFDIFKPQPARFIEKYQRGWGIMLDDVVAGIYANIAVRLIISVFPQII